MRILRCLAPLFALICISCDSATELEKSNIQGSWKGTGSLEEVSSNKSRKYDCNQIEYNVDSDGTDLKIHARKFVCVGMKKTLPAISFRTIGNKLYLGNQEVGLYEKNSFYVLYPTSNSKDTSSIDFERSGNTITIIENHKMGRQEIGTYTVIDLKSDEDSI